GKCRIGLYIIDSSRATIVCLVWNLSMSETNIADSSQGVIEIRVQSRLRSHQIHICQSDNAYIQSCHIRGTTLSITRKILHVNHSLISYERSSRCSIPDPGISRKNPPVVVRNSSSSHGVIQSGTHHQGLIQLIVFFLRGCQSKIG